jgi:cytoskeletal protein CcmA (bactofilin family)
VSYFSSKSSTPPVDERAPGKAAADKVSIIASGMQVTGNIVCTGPLQVFGRVNGDIYAAQLVICEGGKVEGKVFAAEAVIEGGFNGTLEANVVKLQRNAVAEGEIYSKSLAIEQEARFEGVSRRLDKPVEAPILAQVNGESHEPAFRADAPPVHAGQ